ncbi:MAG: ACP S-malonyltransferase [Oscillospiraceae bacterium]|nr:ACP S-malonyltransferase [Oscillospiraceae bacterium]
MSNQNKTIFLFPGQGSQYVGMSKELAEKFNNCTKIKQIHECGSDILGYNLKELLYNSDDAKLANTLYSQPAIFAASLVCLAALEESGSIYTAGVDGSAGHSLGEYAALVNCGAFNLETAFKLIKNRAEIIAKAGENSSGAMAAVIGMSAEDVKEVCEEISNFGSYVTLANHNSPTQCVISGEITAIEKAEELLKSKPVKRLKFIRLKVSAAFHSKLMQTAADEFEATIKDYAFAKPTGAFYSNRTGCILADDEFTNLPSYLANHITGSVLFVDQLMAMQKDGFDTFVEIGPGKVLSGLINKTLKDVNVFNVEDVASLEKLSEFVK